MTAGPSKRRPDEALLETATGIAESQAGGGRRRTEGRRKGGRRHDAASRRANGERRQDVLQLADVARPVVPRERANRLRREHRPRSDATGGGVPEMLRQQRNVVAPIA